MRNEIKHLQRILKIRNDIFQVEKRLDQMRSMLEKKDLTIEELRSRLNRAIVADDGANVSCDQVN